MKTMRALTTLENHMDLMNDALKEVKHKMTSNATTTIDFIQKINKEREGDYIKVPEIENLETCMHNLHVKLSLKKGELQQDVNTSIWAQ